MKKTALCLILIGFCLAGGVVFIRDLLLEHEETEKAIGVLGYVRHAIHAYSRDAKAAGKSTLFPDSLQELVRENYLNTGDRLDFGNIVIEVIRPEGAGRPTDILLRARTSRKLLLCPIDGEIRMEKAR